MRLPGGRRAAWLAASLSHRMHRTPQTTDDLPAWCAAHNVAVITRTTPVEHVRTPPVALGAEHANFAAKSLASVPEQYLVCLEGTRIWGSSGLIVLSDGTFATESAYARHVLDLDPAFTRPLPHHATTIDGDVCTLLGIWSNAHNWFHWVHEGLLRIYGVHERVPDRTRYVVPAGIAPFQIESLRILGIPESQLLRFDGREAWAAERLWFPSLPPVAATHPDAVQWMREHFFRAAGVTATSPSRALFISRADTHHARIVNEQDLRPILDRYGFEIVLPGTLSVIEQVRRFAEAACVVGPTGAGFTNVLFADPTTRVLEILEPRWAEKKAWVIWSLAEALGQPFAHLVATTVENPDHPGRADLAVDPDVLDEALRQWLATDAPTPA